MSYLAWGGSSPAIPAGSARTVPAVAGSLATRTRDDILFIPDRTRAGPEGPARRSGRPNVRETRGRCRGGCRPPRPDPPGPEPRLARDPTVGRGSVADREPHRLVED